MRFVKRKNRPSSFLLQVKSILDIIERSTCKIVFD